MDAAAFLHHLASLTDYSQQIVHIERIPHQGAVFEKLDKPIHPSLQTCLESLGISALYSHQAKALNIILAGKNVIIATPSASGKTLCYHLATLNALVHDKESRALYLFPTKALAQDQLRSLRQIVSFLPSSIPIHRGEVISPAAMATFDGDTPQEQRANIRRQARVVLTNPDMLHLGILPNHQSWSRFFRNLKYIVVDETHIYRGVFGSHVANVLRRLRRLCAFYRSNPQFICCSATIANPQQHAQNLVGLPFEAVVEDGSPHGDKYFTFWNPPLIDEAKTRRRSSNSEAAFLLKELVQKEIRSLVFAATRKLTELIYIYTQEQLPPSLRDKISPYRAGYLPEDRRRIEQQFFEGELLGLVATTALELGINIGDLDATVLSGYPGSIASAWQQAGRSGRSTHSSLSFLIGQENPLDQYLMRNPDFLFSKNFDNAIINPENPYILKPHLLCAAWEKPLHDKDEEFFGPATGTTVVELEQEGRLKRRDIGWHPAPSVSYPAQDINIRSTSGQNYAVIDGQDGQLLETVEASVAFFQIHPGAIYLHQGESYFIRELDLVRRIAWAESKPVDYYTQAMEIHEIRVKKLLKEKDCRGVKVYFGDVDVTITVVGFKRKKQFTEEVITEEYLDLPPQAFPTKALWFDLPQKVIDKIADAGLDFHGGLHACEHAAIGILPLFALCDRNDIGGVSTPFHPDTGKAQIFVYDAHPGGIGIAEKGFEMILQLWQATLKAVADCPCADGCPSCVQSPKCGNNNQPLDKEAAIVLLEELVA
jgi:DEAD/DEAH box helicase domain-containing protein